MSTDIQLRTPDRQDDWNYAKALATAGDQLPRKFQGNPGNVLVAMEYARSLGLPLMQGITGVQVIDGVPSLSALTMQALVRRAGHTLRLAGDNEAAWCEIVRNDDLGFTYRADFTLADAERAGLCKVQPDGTVRARSKQGNPLPWETHTRAMLRARALSECARMACADVLAGVAYTPSELAPERVDYVDAMPDPEPAPQATRTADEPPAGGGGAYAPYMRDEPPTGDVEATTDDPEADAGITQEARMIAEDQERWQSALDAAIKANRLGVVRDLGTLAVQNGWPALAAQARGAYERVKVHLAAINDDPSEQR